MSEDLEDFGGRIRDETGGRDCRKKDLAEIGEPIRAERKDGKLEEGAARWGMGLTVILVIIFIIRYIYNPLY
jgi:hypothetical protein